MPAVLDPQKVPAVICQSLLTCRRSYPDGSKGLTTNPTLGRAFAKSERLGNHVLRTPDYVRWI
jgi:hypothetical protein